MISERGAITGEQLWKLTEEATNLAAQHMENGMNATDPEVKKAHFKAAHDIMVIHNGTACQLQKIIEGMTK